MKSYYKWLLYLLSYKSKSKYKLDFPPREWVLKIFFFLKKAEFDFTIRKKKDSWILCNVVPLYQTTWCHIAEDCEHDMDWHPNFEDHITQVLF
jgi:hypothetical protein